MKTYFLWLAKFLTVLIVLIILPIIVLGGLAGLAKQAAPELAGGNNVAVVELNGPIFDSKSVVNKLHRQIENDSVQGIVLRVNSPGGAVAPSQDIFNTVKKLKKVKPIVASMGTVAASGGLYSALSASKIFVQPGTQTGSIGVIVQLPNISKIADKFGLEFMTITSGKLKDVGNPTRAFTDIDRKFLKETVDKIYQQFLNDVSESRNLEVDKVKEFADGRLILGSEAVELGLADEFGDIYAAARAVYELKGQALPEGTYPDLIYIEDKFAKFKKFFDAILDLPTRLGLNSLEQYQKAKILLF